MSSVDVFLCHTKQSVKNETKSWMREVYRHLTQHGLIVFFDEVSLPGCSISACIKEATCAKVVLAVLDDVFPTKWCQLELAGALEGGALVQTIYDTETFTWEQVGKDAWLQKDLRDIGDVEKIAFVNAVFSLPAIPYNRNLVFLEAAQKNMLKILERLLPPVARSSTAAASSAAQEILALYDRCLAGDWAGRESLQEKFQDDQAAAVLVGSTREELKLSALKVASVEGFRGLSYNSSLKELWLDENKISNIEAFSCLGHSASLQVLFLQKNQIVNVEAFRCLGQNTSLKQLWLEGNEIANIEAFRCLGQNTALTMLRLGYNKLTNIEAFRCLEENASLQDLSLGSNQIVNIEAFRSLAKNNTLTSLDLGGNQISSLEAFRCLAENSSLKELSLVSNQIQSVEALIFALDRNTSLKTLDLRSNGSLLEESRLSRVWGQPCQSRAFYSRPCERGGPREPA